MKKRFGRILGCSILLSFLLSGMVCGTPLGIEEILDGFEPRRDAAFENLRGTPLRISDKRPPLGEGRALYTRHYSGSIIDFAFKTFWLGETNQYDTANDALIENCDYYIGSQSARDDRDSFYWAADELVRLVEFFENDGSRTPGLITPECKAKLLEMMWLYVKNTSKMADAEYVQSKTWHVHESENHHIQRFSTVWHFSKFLRNESEYRDRPYDDGSIAEEHYQAWTAYAKVWLGERAKKGLLIEMANGGYGLQTLKCVYNFHDFGDAELSSLSSKFLDLYWAIWAQEQLEGVRGGAKSRVYQGRRSQTGRNELGHLAWYYLGINNPEKLQRNMLTVVTSAYRMPQVVIDLAVDPEGRGCYEISQRAQGLVEAGFFGPPDYRLCADGGGIVRYSYCTPEFIMGTVLLAPVEFEDWAMISSQNRWQGVIFSGDPDARIYPQVKENGSPDKAIVTYNACWSVQSKGSLITQKLPGKTINGKGNTMCVWISDAGRTGNLPERDGWVFAEYDGAYAAIKCVSGSYHWKKSSEPVAGHWMVCAKKFTPVIIEVARTADFANFSEFQTRVLSLPITFDDKLVEYTGLDGFQLTLAPYPGRMKVNGKEVDLAPPNVFFSPFIQSKYNSGIVNIRRGSHSLMLNLNAGTPSR